MTKADEPYWELAHHYARHPAGGPANETFVEILKFYFSPEEARLASVMSFSDLEPEEEIARRAGFGAGEAREALAAMSTRTWIRGLAQPDGVRTFRLLPMVPGLFEMPFYLRDRTPDLERLADLYDVYFKQGFGHELHAGKIQISRVLPADQDAPKEQVTPYEDVVKLLEHQDQLYLLPCVCRLAYQRCDHSVNVCLTLVGPEDRQQFSSHVPVFDSKYSDDRYRPRLLSAGEGLELLRQSEDEGLVHVTTNTKDELEFLCNCCRCCCTLMRGASELSIPFGVAPSAFWMTVDEDECTACEECLDRCPVSAIKIEDDVAVVNHDVCLGCGVCAGVCTPEAMHLEARQEHLFVPPDTRDEMYRIIGLDRGRAWPVSVPEHSH